MAAPRKIDEFPDVENKLQAPTKKSLFERQKADAEAKRVREEAETKAVYEDFVKSFDDEEKLPPVPAGGSRFSSGGLGQPKRHYTGGQGLGAPTGPSAGRGFGNTSDRGGKFGSGPGSLGPSPQILNKKRTFEGFQQREKRDDRGLLAFDDHEEERAPKRAFNTSDDEDAKSGKQDREEEKHVAKPTLRLASLPPGSSPAFIKAVLPANLTIDAVRILPSPGPGVYMERKSLSAIVTLAKDTAANDIDTAVNSMQNKYLGYGYYLSLHRHLSSAAISTATAGASLSTSAASQPFGAKQVDLGAGRGVAPQSRGRGFAPPTSYAPSGPGQLARNSPVFHVPVQAPRDIKELKLIHKVVESLLTHGPEFEALLMSRPDVQREEKWAWLWDPRSTGGVWYRWRLWEVLTGSKTQRGQGKYLPLFEDSAAWKSPDQPLAYEYTTKLDEFVSDSEYNSSDDDESGDEGPRRPQHTIGAPPDTNILTDDGKAYLNPLEKAKLTHLLARLPTASGNLRKGDVARITAFAISHAGRGADEVVSMIISNIEKPFAYTSANPDRRAKKDKDSSGDDEVDNEDEDTSAASLIGIYLISDILSSSSTSGVRHAWRYRQLFESALKSRHVFEGLGRMERKTTWGRIRAEKWKRSVQNILSLWEGWCVFPQESQEWLVNVFNNPPMTAKEKLEARRKEDDEKMGEKGKSKWKSVEVAPKQDVDTKQENLEEDIDGDPMEEDEDVDGEPMIEDEDVDGLPMEGEFDGEPMEEDAEVKDEAVSIPSQHEEPLDKSKETKPDESIPTAVQARRRRPRAVDMFADSDDDN